MAIKLDTEKSYDKLNWHFIQKCLTYLGFSKK